MLSNPVSDHDDRPSVFPGESQLSARTRNSIPGAMRLQRMRYPHAWRRVLLPWSLLHHPPRHPPASRHHTSGRVPAAATPDQCSRAPTRIIYATTGSIQADDPPEWLSVVVVFRKFKALRRIQLAPGGPCSAFPPTSSRRARQGVDNRGAAKMPSNRDGEIGQFTRLACG